MDQVFYRQPLKTHDIEFEVKSVEYTPQKHVFSHGNVSGPARRPYGTIPVYYPECNNIVIDFEDEETKPLSRTREKSKKGK